MSESQIYPVNPDRNEPWNDLSELPIYSDLYEVNHLTDQNPYAENTSRNYLNELSDLQIFEKKEIKGRHYYVNSALVEILSYYILFWIATEICLEI